MKRQVAFTLRFDPEFYERLKKVCRREGRSVTGFVNEAVAKTLAEEEAAALFQAFTIVGEDVHETSVEFAQDAQREVVLKSG